MLDQAVTTFSVSILTKEEENALALRKYDKVETTLQTVPPFQQQKNLRWGVTRSERAFIS